MERNPGKHGPTGTQMVKDVESKLWNIQSEPGSKGTAFGVKDKLGEKVNPYSTDINETYSQSKILVANYEKIALEDVASEQKHLSKEERCLLLKKLRENIRALE